MSAFLPIDMGAAEESAVLFAQPPGLVEMTPCPKDADVVPSQPLLNARCLTAACGGFALASVGAVLISYTRPSPSKTMGLEQVDDVAAARAKLAAKWTRTRRSRQSSYAPSFDIRLQSKLKKIRACRFPGVTEVNLFKEDGTVIHFSDPNVTSSIQANTYVVAGNSKEKTLQQLLPDIILQLGPDDVNKLKEGMGQRRLEIDNEDEKEAIKMVQEIGMSAVPGINRATIVKDKLVFAISKPDVYKSPTSGTYAIFGEAKVHDSDIEPTDIDVAPAIPEMEEVAEAAEDEAVDESGLDPKDIELVMSQAGCNRAKAAQALKDNDGDLVNSIMSLTK